MLKKRDNERLTQVGRGTSMGELLRPLCPRVGAGLMVRTRCGGPAGIVLLALALLACSPGRSPTPTSGSGSQADSNRRPLVMAVRVEPPSVATRVLGQPGVSLTVARGLFNATLALIDDRAVPVPQLAERLPSLNSDDWPVFADGRMETRVHLKPGLTWHDGAALTADDFVFAWRVYLTPDYGHAVSAPYHAIDDISVQDAQTLVIRWSRPYPGAGVLSTSKNELVALPRHLLEADFLQMTADGFAGHPFWTREFVGVGPYRLVQWEPGSFIEAVAFDGYVLGRPKLDRVRMLFISDGNTALANLLAGEVQVAADDAIGVSQIDILRREWGKDGVLHLVPGGSWRNTAVQLRPEISSPAAILDSRVRRALAHVVDRDALNDTVYSSSNLLADSMVPSNSELGRAADQAVVKYPYDPRRTEQLMAEAGFQKGADAIYASPSQGRLAVSLSTTSGGGFETEMTIMASGWRTAGFDIQENVLPASQARDPEIASSFPGLSTRSTAMGEPALLGMVTSAIPRPENRWRGPNRGGWSNPDYDRLVEAFSLTLDPQERASQLARLVRIFSEDLPAISLYFPSQAFVHPAALSGPRLVAADSNMLWNVQDWEQH